MKKRRDFVSHPIAAITNSAERAMKGAFCLNGIASIACIAFLAEREVAALAPIPNVALIGGVLCFAVGVLFSAVGTVEAYRVQLGFFLTDDDARQATGLRHRKSATWLIALSLALFFAGCLSMALFAAKIG